MDETQTALYTLEQAAAVKGVSYHTASRAVRTGKLPVWRLGRQILITVADLASWQPMYSRRPRRYAAREPDPTIEPAFYQMPEALVLDAETRQMLTRFAALDPVGRAAVLAFVDLVRRGER